MKRRLLILVVVFACVLLGYSSAVAQNCYRFNGTWTCEGLGYSGFPSQTCKEASVCVGMGGMSQCQIMTTPKNGPGFFGTYNQVVFAAWGNPISLANTDFIICVNVHYCNSYCEPKPGTGEMQCTTWSTMPFGGFNYQLADPACEMMMP